MAGVEDKIRWLVIVFWLGINALLFGLTFKRYNSQKEYYYLKTVTKNGLPWARGAAAILNFNCFLILLPVCRNMLSFFRGVDCCGMGKNLQRLLDNNLKFHRYIAYVICIFTAVHVGAHVFNFESLVDAYQGIGLRHQLSILPDEGNKTYVNPIRKQDADSVTELLKTVAGVTGCIITISLILMVTSSTELLRRSYFEVFWYTHHLFVIFFIGLITHGMQGLLRRQTNTADHDPEECQGRIDNLKCPTPHFEASGPETWKWLILPLIIYFIERCIRFVRSLQKVSITKIIKHPSNVIEIRMKKAGFRHEAGQYIFIQCPSISRLEWHPFTLTSSPEQDFFSVHIRKVGDWTTSLSTTCDGLEETNTEKILSVSVDGPFGTASSDYFKYTTCVFIGAGIGVTPFASILKSIWYRHEHSCASLQIKKVYFYWVCRDTNAFEWFAELLQSLEHQMSEKNSRGFLQYNVYLTRGWTKDEARNIMMRDQVENNDVITGLEQKTHFGRPEWNDLFKKIANENPTTDVGVFYCGPAGLSHTLRMLCNQYGTLQEGTKFYYNKENF